MPGRWTRAVGKKYPSKPSWSGWASGTLMTPNDVKEPSCGRNDTGPGERDLARAVPDRDHRRVAVPHEVHRRAVDLERVVDPEVVRYGVAPGRSVTDSSASKLSGVPQLAPARPRSDTLNCVDGERERGQVGGVETGARA